MLTSKKQIDKSRLGRLLVNRGYISEAQLDAALVEQAASGARLGEVLIAQGLICERELERTLKHQKRYRYAAAFVAMAVAPLQPMVAFAAGSAGAAVIPTQSSQVKGLAGLSGLKPLDDSEMASVTAKGLVEDIGQLTDIVERVKNSENGEIFPEDGDAVPQVTLLAHLAAPMTNFLDSNTKIEGVVYDTETAPFSLNTDGSVNIAMPTHIDRISMTDIKPLGAADGAASMGNIYISDINFANTSMTIRLR
ncbi:MAG: pilus assembly protein PilB [Pseudomonadales bacterium]|nr:pilus assembly protein PilB [Pseudomonadales bacterium]